VLAAGDLEGALEVFVHKIRNDENGRAARQGVADVIECGDRFVPRLAG